MGERLTPRDRSVRTNERACWLSYMTSVSRIVRLPPSATLLDEGQYLCWLARCIASSNRPGNPTSAAINLSIRLTTSPNCGHRSQPALELGHHQTAGSGQVDLLLSLCHPRCLQPLCRRLDGRAAGERGTGQAVHRGDHSQAGDSRRPAHHPRRPGRVMTSKPVAFLLADLGVTKTHSRPYVSDDNPYSESQSGPSSTGRISQIVRFHPGRPRLLSEFFRGTTTSIATRAGLADPGHGPFRPSSSRVGGAPGCTRRRLSGAPGPFRPATAQTLTLALGGWINKPAKTDLKTEDDVTKFPCRVSQNA